MTTDRPFDDWRYRYSHLARSLDDHWYVVDRLDDLNWRRWRWFRPDDLIRYALHHSWSRRYW